MKLLAKLKRLFLSKGRSTLSNQVNCLQPGIMWSYFYFLTLVQIWKLNYFQGQLDWKFNHNNLSIQKKLLKTTLPLQKVQQDEGKYWRLTNWKEIQSFLSIRNVTMFLCSKMANVSIVSHKSSMKNWLKNL